MLTVAGEVVILGIHLHLGVGEFDVVLALTKVSQQSFSINLSDSLLDELDLVLGLLRTVCSVACKILVEGVQVGNSLDHVIVVTLHEGLNGFVILVEERVLVGEACSEVVAVASESKLVDHTVNVARDFLAGVRSVVG